MLTPTSASWANPIEAQFGPLRSFTATTITVDHFHAQTVDTRLWARGAPTTII